MEAPSSQRASPEDPSIRVAPHAPLRPHTRPNDIRNVSIDSTVSSISSSNLLAQKMENSAIHGESKEGSEPHDVAFIIHTAGSVEAAISKLLHEKQQAASHNAQLWRLVEKQRAMILGLNKDLEKSLKEKEKYRRKLKEQLVQSASMSSLITQDGGNSTTANVNRSPSEITRGSPSMASLEQGQLNPSGMVASEVSNLSNVAGRPGIPQNVPKRLGLEPPSTPLSGSGRDGNTAEPSQNSRTKDKEEPESPTSQRRMLRGNDGDSSKTPQSFSSPKQPGNRKAPPAPLQLSPQPYVATSIAHSDSEYEDNVESARAEQMTRGRRKTREEDDRDREIAAMQEAEERSRSKKTHKSRSTPADEDRDNARQRMLAANSTLDPSVKQLKQQHVAPLILSPGLPMSPRPGDRPMNSPMPRAPNKALHPMPMSPKMGFMGLPLSPRAPKHAIPLPIQHSVPATSSRLRDELQNRTFLDDSPDESPVKEVDATLESGLQSDIYSGFVSEHYPELLLPPHALPSISIKTASSRLRPSRQSYLFPKAGDENPVLTLAVHLRTDSRQLWRVEKTLAALAAFDTQIKVASAFRGRFPDKALFIGHAPAKIDARRSAIDAYFDQLMQFVTEDKSAVILGKFMSTDAISPDGGELSATSPVEVRSDTPVTKPRQQRAGYLTKRGKNFGGWKARYFVLDSPSLRYFEAPGGAHLGSIKLQNAQIGKQSTNAGASSFEDEDNQFRHAFLILEPKKKDSTSLVRHVLCAESDEERDAWVDALLQYVDFREDEEDHHKATPGIKHDTTGPRLQKSNTDMKTSAKNDPVVSVSYNETVAGNAPVIGPSSARKPETPSPSSDDASAHHLNISGPTNLTVIQNAGEWGMKIPLTPSTKDLGKDKKRSMFSAFKGRSSADLASEKHSALGATIGEPYGRPIFGMPLAEAVEYIQPATGPTGLPIVVYRCLEFLTAKDATNEEGIFRLSGSNTIIKAIKDRFNTDGDVDLLAGDDSYDIHAVASLLKLYLRELPASILTRELHLEFLQCLEMQPEEKLRTLNRLVRRLPQPNRTLLHALAIFLLAIVSNADINKMNRRNVGIVFAPTLNVPAPLISSFVEDHEIIFATPSEDADVSSSNLQVPIPQDPSDLRSPRRQMFSDLPTPAYHQTTFQSFETGMVPMQSFRHQSDNNISVKARNRESGMMLLNPHLAPRNKTSMSRLHDEESTSF